MKNTIHITVEENEAGDRVDLFLSKKYQDYSRSYFNELIKNGEALLNDKIVKSSTKVKINDVISKDHNDFNISPFRVGGTARLGYKGFNVFGTYYFTQFFRDNRGPAMNPFAIGIGILNW